MAEVAELNSEVSFGNYYTMNIKVNGFRDSFENFIEQYLEKILSYGLNGNNDASLFESIKEKLTKNYANQLLGNPYQLAYESIIAALRDGSSNPTQKKL
jgi:secreted Zn-dependent insulinase-like peptidase